MLLHFPSLETKELFEHFLPFQTNKAAVDKTVETSFSSGREDKMSWMTSRARIPLSENRFQNRFLLGSTERSLLLQDVFTAPPATTTPPAFHKNTRRTKQTQRREVWGGVSSMNTQGPKCFGQILWSRLAGGSQKGAILCTRCKSVA